MIIDQVIKDPTGRNLVVQGSAIDDYIISSLLKLGIMSVYIREGSADPDDPDAILSPKAAAMVKQLRTDDRSKVTLSDSVRQRVSTGVQYIFNNTNSEELTQATNMIADSLMEAINENDAIAVDISSLKTSDEYTDIDSYGINENDAIAVDISSLKTSDEYTFKHSVDVATISMILAKQMKLPDNEIHDIGVSGLLHDIGKTMIPNEILNKPGRLTDDEFNIMKKHSVYGYNMLKDRKDLNNSILMGVLQHHERIDGTGYPLGFDAPKICQFAKILSVADVYDALVTKRPYKDALSQRDAVEMLMSMTNQLDIGVMRAFMSSMILYPVDSIVQLSNGEKARVVKNSEYYILRPTVVGVDSGRVYNLGNDLKCASIIIL